MRAPAAPSRKIRRVAPVAGGRYRRSGVAQSAEHSAVNRRVVGSSPTPGVDLIASRALRETRDGRPVNRCRTGERREQGRRNRSPDDRAACCPVLTSAGPRCWKPRSWRRSSSFVNTRAELPASMRSSANSFCDRASASPRSRATRTCRSMRARRCASALLVAATRVARRGDSGGSFERRRSRAPLPRGAPGMGRPTSRRRSGCAA